MNAPITVAQLQALRSIAAESPHDFPLLAVLCDRVEHLQEIELAALNFVTATSERDEAIAAMDLCRHLGVELGLAVEPARLAA